MYPTVLYHISSLNGTVFTDKDKYEQAKKQGWVDAPQDIGKPVVVAEPEVSKKGYPAKKKPSVKRKKKVK